jgi:HAD superfamily hydrolase (TIGR01490 family)
MKKALRKTAIFDIDGTIFRSSLLVELVETLIDQGNFPKSARLMYEKEYRSWLERKGPYQEYLDALVAVFMKHIKGLRYEAFLAASKIVVERNRHQTYRYTTELVKKYKKKGYYLLAISQSPKSLLDPFCKELGFDKVYGRIYETRGEDELTGEVVDLHLIANKANIVRRAVEKEGLTLVGSVGVGDTEGDIPMLELVETPIAFNPNKKLYRIAKLNGWKVVVERKDMIYEL